PAPRVRIAVVSQRRLASYGVAIGSVLCASVAALPLYPLADELPALLLLAAVAVSGAFGGYGPALLATAAGLLVLDFFFGAPPFVFEVTAGIWLDLLAFLFVALLVGSLNARLRVASL